MCRWWGVIVAARLAGALRTKSVASLVVMCSSTTFSPGWRASSGARCRSMNTASRSKMSMSALVTSPWMSNGMPMRSRVSITGVIASIDVTPAAELVVAWAG